MSAKTDSAKKTASSGKSAPSDIATASGKAEGLVAVARHGHVETLAGEPDDQCVDEGLVVLGQQHLGLGLSIVRHVASNHQGRVEVDSREGQGSTFTLILPSPPEYSS